MAEITNQEPLTLTDQLRKRIKGVLEPVGAFLNRIGIYPNTMTLFGLFGNTIGAFFLAQGRMSIGGIIILAMGPIDALDGTMARLRGESSVYGAFVDSVTDRYSDLVILGGLLIHFLSQADWQAALLTYIAAAGSVLVSYVRARAQSLGYEAKIGTFSRLERYLVLTPSLIFNLPRIGVGILAIGANLTALQRIVHIRREVKRES